MNNQIDVTGYDMAETLAKARRRQTETEQAQGLSELGAMLLPLSLALTRLVRTGAPTAIAVVIGVSVGEA